MVDVREILESPEMNDVLQAIDALRRKFAPQASSDGDHEWPLAITPRGRFPADLVLRILLDDGTYYPGYKDVLTAAFGGWLIAPRSHEAREWLMIHAAATFMETAAASVGSEEHLIIQKDIAARYLFIGPEFLKEVYDRLGGHQAFADVPSLDDLWDAFERIERPIFTAARAIAYLHYAVDQFGRPGIRFYPSLSKAIAVLEDIRLRIGNHSFKERYVSRSLLHERWSQNKQTLALIYAASTIQVNRKTLLRIILDGLLSYPDHGRYFRVWVGRARYVSMHIFSRMEDHELERKTDRLLGDVKAISFKPPKLDEIERAIVKEKFDEKNKELMRLIRTKKEA